MAYSASALSFMLEDLAKPVIFTGAQLPIGALRTDGKENLITSIVIAAAKEYGKPVVPEVCIYFESKLSRATEPQRSMQNISMLSVGQLSLPGQGRSTPGLQPGRHKDTRQISGTEGS